MSAVALYDEATKKPSCLARLDCGFQVGVNEAGKLGVKQQYLFSSCLGFNQDGVTDDSAIFVAAVNKAIAENKTLVMEGGIDPYLFSSTGLVAIPAGETARVLIDEGAVIKAATGMTVPLIGFDGTRSGEKAIIYGTGKLDASESAHVVGTQSCTAIQLRELTYGSVLGGLELFAGDNYKNLSGDSGITANTIELLQVNNVLFQGWADSGVYATGGAIPDSWEDTGGQVNINNCRFVRCKNAVSVKREHRTCDISGNDISQCYLGATSYPAVSGGAAIKAAHNMRIHNNYFDRTVRPIDIRITPGHVITGNIFVDWGEEFDGNNIPSEDAVVIQGCQGVIVKGNTFRAPNTNPNIVIEIRDYTYDGVDYEAGKCYTDNVYFDCNRAFDDANASLPSYHKVVEYGLPLAIGGRNAETFIELDSLSLQRRRLYKGSTLLEQWS